MDILSVQLNTVVDHIMAAGIITALAALGIQQLAGHLGVKYFTAVMVFKFNQTAFCTAVTEQFPLLCAHLCKLFGLPKISHIYLLSSVAGLKPEIWVAASADKNLSHATRP